MSHRPPLAALRLAAIAVAVAACDGTTAPDTAPSPGLDLAPDTTRLAWDDTLRLRADWAEPAGGGGTPVVWSSSDTTVLRVDATGLVTAVGGGAARVTARAGEGVKTASTTPVRVVPPR